MILECLITTRDASGQVHVAPMGPRVESHDFHRFLLRPFPTSQTYRNLLRHPEGVLHVTDDVQMLARAALGKMSTPANHPAQKVQGAILSDCCRYMEFRVTTFDDTEQRMRLDCEVVAKGTLRDFFGFNRAKHAVLEAAILATRFSLLPREEIDREYQRLRGIVDKTAGPAESDAMAFLEQAWHNFQEKRA